MCELELQAKTRQARGGPATLLTHWRTCNICNQNTLFSRLPAFWVTNTMYEDSIQKASSVEVAEQRKGSVLRPVVTRGDSFHDEPDGARKLDDISRAGLGSTRLSRIPLSRGSSYQPDWTQDAEDVSVPPPVPVQELGSPEDLKDMLRMGRTQEMRVGLNSVTLSQKHGADSISTRECFANSR